MRCRRSSTAPRRIWRHRPSEKRPLAAAPFGGSVGSKFRQVNSRFQKGRFHLEKCTHTPTPNTNCKSMPASLIASLGAASSRQDRSIFGKPSKMLKIAISCACFGGSQTGPLPPGGPTGSHAARYVCACECHGCPLFCP